MGWHIPNTVRGYDFGEVASALQKSIRRGWEDQALHWAVELDRSGYGRYCWYRLLVICSEDVGLAEPGMPAAIWALHGMWSEVRKKKKASAPERLYLVHAVLCLVRARKSRIVDDAMWTHYNTDDGLYEIPDVALDSHTRRGRSMGRGPEFQWSESLHLENEHSDLTNSYAVRARAVGSGGVSFSNLHSAADSALDFEVLDSAMREVDTMTATSP